MPYVRRYRKNALKAKLPYKRRARKANAKPTRTFTKMVQKIIHKNAETKQAYNALALTAFNSIVLLSTDVIQVLPSINIANTDAGRIGDQIRGQKLSVKGHLILSTSNNSVANSRIAVRMMVVQPRYNSNFEKVQADNAVWMPSLLKKGGATSSFSGTIADLYAPINSDAIIKYYDKVVYMTIPYIGSTTGTTSVNTTYSQDLVSSAKLFSFNIKMKNKLLKYDSGISSLNPTNFSPVFLLGYTHLDGTAADVVNTQVSCAYDAIFDYEDM